MSTSTLEHLWVCASRETAKSRIADARLHTLAAQLRYVYGEGVTRVTFLWRGNRVCNVTDGLGKYALGE